MNALSRGRRQAGTPARDLIEDAVHLLRRCPAETFFVYLAGAAPFWLGFLYFLSDMSQNAYAGWHITEASLAVALLYIAMKCAQAAFAARLRSLVTERADAPWNFRRVFRLVCAQAKWQPLGFLIRPLAFVIPGPYGWMVAFFQNLTVLGDGTAGHEDSLSARAWTQARFWPGQNHAALTVLWVFGFFVWLNVIAVLGLAPYAVKMFFGIDTAFSQTVDGYFNTSFFVASLAIASLIVEPLWKAVYVVRCFYGAAQRTGEDLGVELAQAARARRRTCAAPFAASILVFACLIFSSPSQAGAEPAPGPESATAGEIRRLDERIDHVLEQREYAWRAPRERLSEGAKIGWLSAWFQGVNEAFIAMGKDAARVIYRAFTWIRGALSGGPSLSGGSGWDWVNMSVALIIILGAGLLILLIWAIMRIVRSPRKLTVQAQAISIPPDLRAEDLVADQLPEEGWMQLAREHAERGDHTLALRAAWLGCLAHLGQRELLRIARHKSNRDYDQELRRRARALTPLLGAFAENLQAFERAWYGRHDVRSDDLSTFEGNLETIRRDG